VYKRNLVDIFYHIREVATRVAIRPQLAINTPTRKSTWAG